MDNERKVGTGNTDNNELVDRSKQAFLQDVVADLKRRQQHYDPAAEFAKTKHNRSYLVLFVILASIAVTAVSAVVVYSLTERDAARFQIQIDDFEDINLREILDSVSRLENRLQRLNDEGDEIQQARERGLRDARVRFEREVRLLPDRGLTAAQQQQQRHQLQQALNQETESIESEYAAQLSRNQMERDDVIELLSQYDARQTELAQEQQASLDNQMQLYELEMQELRDRHSERMEGLKRQYEQTIAELESHNEELRTTLQDRLQRERAELIRRFNPSLDGSGDEALLDEPIADMAEPDFVFSSVYGIEGIANESEMNRLAGQFEGLQRLINRMQDVPYVNSVPGILSQIEFRAAAVARQLETMLQNSAAVLESRRDELAEQELYIEQVLAGAEFMVRNNRENGYIINPANAEQMVVYVDPDRNPYTGQQAFVFRADDQKIAEIELIISEKNRQYARVISRAEGQIIQPFDTILLQVGEDSSRSHQ